MSPSRKIIIGFSAGLLLGIAFGIAIHNLALGIGIGIILGGAGIKIPS